MLLNSSSDFLFFSVFFFCNLLIICDERPFYLEAVWKLNNLLTTCAWQLIADRNERPNRKNSNSPLSFRTRRYHMIS